MHSFVESLAIKSALGAVLAWICLIGIRSQEALAATFPVNDTDPATLAAAITAANASADPTNTIAIAATGTITLTGALPQINPQSGTVLLVQGPGAGNLTIDAANTTRAFFVLSGTVTISGIKIANGRAKGGNGGGGDASGGGGLGAGGVVFVNAGDVVLEDVVFADNSAIGGDSADQTGGLQGDHLQRHVVSASSAVGNLQRHTAGNVSRSFRQAGEGSGNGAAARVIDNPKNLPEGGVKPQR